MNQEEKKKQLEELNDIRRQIKIIIHGADLSAGVVALGSVLADVMAQGAAEAPDNAREFFEASVDHLRNLFLKRFAERMADKVHAQNTKNHG